MSNNKEKLKQALELVLTRSLPRTRVSAGIIEAPQKVNFGAMVKAVLRLVEVIGKNWPVYEEILKAIEAIITTYEQGKEVKP